MTVVITEGFGEMAFSDRIAQLFEPHDGRAASINGATQVRAGALRPEIIVASEELSSIANAATSVGLEVGGTVRVIRAPLFGEVGKVVELPHDPQVLPTGASTRVLKVELTSGAHEIVPRANVEVM